MSRKIGPTLTAEEWAALGEGEEEISAGEPSVFLCINHGLFGIRRALHLEDGSRIQHYENTERLHATAALCLQGQPFGFTWEDVSGLTAIAEEMAVYFPEVTERALDLAGRIAALLPPREPSKVKEAT